jgi:hypothetical protein
VKELLSRAGHTFMVRNVDEDHDAYTELLALGVRSVPATLIGSVVIKGYDPEAIQSALDDAGGS